MALIPEEALSAQLKNLPTSPGVYRYFDASDEILYVGKARNLRNRVRSYFRKNAGHGIRIEQLVSKIARIETTVVDSEAEALLLEDTLIKQLRPPYNVQLKDDKRYLYLRISTNEPYPRISLVRKATGKGRYFGPYTSSRQIKSLLRVIRPIFPYCDCKTLKPGKQRTCLPYFLKRCLGPCIPAVTPEEYQQMIRGLISFLEGKTGDIVETLTEKMQQSAAAEQFEQAKLYRDQLRPLDTLLQEQKVVWAEPVSRDILAIAAGESEAVVTVLRVREGKLTGSAHFPLQHRGSSPEQILQRFVISYYRDMPDPPESVILPFKVSGLGLLQQLLKERKRGFRFLIPKLGQKKRLLRMAEQNAETELKRRHIEWLNKSRSEQQGLEELNRFLEIEARRIECYDISTLQGTSTVGSMVVFLDGEAVSAQYRRFQIKTLEQQDDFAAMAEVLSRRFGYLPLAQQGIIAPQKGGETSGDDSFRHIPDLIVIDGGKGQLSAAAEILDRFNFPEKKPLLISLAKRFEEIYFPGISEPRLLPNDSPALYLLQRIRDEAHRFAITYHRSVRAKKSISSPLDKIAGIGPATKKKLISHFGSVKKIREASKEELIQVVGHKLAEKIQGDL